MILPFGIDISHHQGEINFDKLKSSIEPVLFIAVKATEGDDWIDDQFARNWDAAKRIGLHRLAYHFMCFGDDPKKQMELFLRVVNPIATDRLVLDAETSDGWSKAHITTTLRVCMNIVREHTGRYPIIYSRAGWVNQYITVQDMPTCDWWLAQYRMPFGYPAYTPEATPPPTLPRGVTSWLIHQTGERGDGKSFGAESHYIDLDRWNGTAEDIIKYFCEDSAEPVPAPEPVLFRARVNVNALNIRSGAGINNSAIGLLRLGDEVDVYEERERWYRIGADRWCAGWLTIKISEPITGGLDAPLYSQSDPAWRYDRLGRSTTIGANGCLLTGVAMLLKYWSKDTDPRRLNAAMKKAGGYSGNLWIWEALTKLYPDIVMDWDNWIVSQGGYTLSRIDALLTADTPVLAQTDYNPATAYLDQHWVLMTGKQGDDYIINDPVDGQRVLFNTRYGEPAKKIFRIAAYKKVN